MHAHVITVQAIHAKAHMVDAHHVFHIFKVLHKAVQIVGHLGFGHSGVGSGLNADHAALGSNGLNHLIAGHPLGVPHAFCTHMAHNDRLLGIGDRIISSLRAAVGYVNEHTHLVHSLYALLAEHGQAAVMDLLAAVAQRIAFGIGHTQLADAQAVENIDAVYLVFNRSGSLHHKYHGDLSGLLGGKNVIHGLTMDNKILMSQIAQPHTQIVNDVDPLPAAGTGDDIHTVQLVIEYAVDI